MAYTMSVHSYANSIPSISFTLDCWKRSKDANKLLLPEQEGTARNWCPASVNMASFATAVGEQLTVIAWCSRTKERFRHYFWDEKNHLKFVPRQPKKHTDNDFDLIKTYHCRRPFSLWIPAKNLFYFTSKVLLVCYYSSQQECENLSFASAF